MVTVANTLVYLFTTASHIFVGGDATLQTLTPQEKITQSSKEKSMLKMLGGGEGSGPTMTAKGSAKSQNVQDLPARGSRALEQKSPPPNFSAGHSRGVPKKQLFADTENQPPQTSTKPPRRVGHSDISLSDVQKRSPSSLSSGEGGGQPVHHIAFPNIGMNTGDAHLRHTLSSDELADLMHMANLARGGLIPQSDSDFQQNTSGNFTHLIYPSAQQKKPSPAAAQPALQANQQQNPQQQNVQGNAGLVPNPPPLPPPPPPQGLNYGPPKLKINKTGQKVPPAGPQTPQEAINAWLKSGGTPSQLKKTSSQGPKSVDPRDQAMASIKSKPQLKPASQRQLPPLPEPTPEEVLSTQDALTKEQTKLTRLKKDLELSQTSQNKSHGVTGSQLRREIEYTQRKIEALKEQLEKEKEFQESRKKASSSSSTATPEVTEPSSGLSEEPKDSPLDQKGTSLSADENTIPNPNSSDQPKSEKDIKDEKKTPNLPASSRSEVIPQAPDVPPSPSAKNLSSTSLTPKHANRGDLLKSLQRGESIKDMLKKTPEKTLQKSDEQNEFGKAPPILGQLADVVSRSSGNLPILPDKPNDSDSVSDESDWDDTEYYEETSQEHKERMDKIKKEQEEKERLRLESQKKEEEEKQKEGKQEKENPTVQHSSLPSKAETIDQNIKDLEGQVEHAKMQRTISERNLKHLMLDVDVSSDDSDEEEKKEVKSRILKAQKRVDDYDREIEGLEKTISFHKGRLGKLLGETTSQMSDQGKGGQKLSSSSAPSILKRKESSFSPMNAKTLEEQLKQKKEEREKKRESSTLEAPSKEASTKDAHVKQKEKEEVGPQKKEGEPKKDKKLKKKFSLSNFTHKDFDLDDG